MTESDASSDFVCRSCHAAFHVADQGKIRCPNCGWKGEVYFFPDALPLEINQPERAVPENATCLHHPEKKATDTCSATGDYICALCAIELNGDVYGVEYLNSTAGKQKIREIYKRILKRPDRIILVYVLTLIIPGVNVVTGALAIAWVLYGYSLHRKAVQASKSDPLYARAVPKWMLHLLFVVLTLVLIAWTAAVAFVVYDLLTGLRWFHSLGDNNGR